MRTSPVRKPGILSSRCTTSSWFERLIKADRASCAMSCREGPVHGQSSLGWEYEVTFAYLDVCAHGCDLLDVRVAQEEFAFGSICGRVGTVFECSQLGVAYEQRMCTDSRVARAMRRTGVCGSERKPNTSRSCAVADWAAAIVPSAFLYTVSRPDQRKRERRESRGVAVLTPRSADPTSTRLLSPPTPGDLICDGTHTRWHSSSSRSPSCPSTTRPASSRSPRDSPTTASASSARVGPPRPSGMPV